MTRILIVGSGAREHAIACALKRSPQTSILFCCGTNNNPGINSLTEDYQVLQITNVADIVTQARTWNIDFAIIGPEAPLEAGLADALWDVGIPTIGPRKLLAQIETSKGFARELMQKYKIAGLPRFKVFTNNIGIHEFLHELGGDNYVIKANGLMGGKGVKLAGEHLASFEDALQFCNEIFAVQQTVVIEEKLRGQEFSLMCFYDGKTLIPMPLVQDHKRAFIDDTGPNTGGMGSYSDANHLLPFLTEKDFTTALQINHEVLNTLQVECSQSYKGIFYGSFIATKDGVCVIEFNARFGDPECLNVLTILESDFLEICKAMIESKLKETDVYFTKSATVCKYAVPNGYPDQPAKNKLINTERVDNPSHLYLAGVDQRQDGLYTTGARIAAFIGTGNDLMSAEKIAEQGISNLHGEFFHRTDIGSSSLIQKRIAFMQNLRAT